MNWAYLVRCADDSLYAGWTNDLPRRLAAHNAGTGARYTRSRRPVTLAYAEALPDRHAAMVREAQLKALPRIQKQALADAWAAAGGLAALEEAGVDAAPVE